ncbi:pyridoxine/pyridoxamine 5'-phosphate oxidase [Brachybacterium huguangmaarense]
MSELFERLRTLPAFPADLPVLDVEHAPADPEALFLQWLDDAIDSGARQPHAMTFATVRPDGTPVARTLIVEDIDADGIHVSTHRTSRKGQEIAADQRATMLFFWRESGRQVRVTGRMVELSDEASQRDWEARPSYTGEPNPDWQLYALVPEEYEFMQAREDRHHTRLDYRRDGMAWERGLVPTPAG